MTLVDKSNSPSVLAPDSPLLSKPNRESLSLSLCVGLVFLSTIAYAATPILAKLAYAHGGTPATVALFRFVVGAVIFFGIWRFNYSPIKLTGSILVLGFVLRYANAWKT